MAYRHELRLLLISWFALAAITVLLAKPNLASPGLYYDEAVFAGMAKDFLTGQTHGQHMPDHATVVVWGRPFPIFTQPYLGALKSWILMPALALFGASVPVMRATNLFCGLIALLCFMLGSWRWLGVRTALLAGALLAFDPSYFFLSVWDWGAATPSFVCRCASFYFVVLWSQQRRAWHAFVAAFFAGLGLFNKVDFGILLLGAIIAGILCYRRQLWSRASRKVIAVATVGFALGAAPMLVQTRRVLALVASSGPNELSEKLHTVQAMYDGSYFYRLMKVGGLFNKMYDPAAGTFPFFGVGLIIAIAILFSLHARNVKDDKNPAAIFLITAAALVILGVLCLPGAVRIHHAVLVFPLPHLIVAGAGISIWKSLSAPGAIQRVTRVLLLVGTVILLANQFWTIGRTQRLVRETGGRGRWSDALDDFCRENRNRSDLTIVSLDWGFNEQLIFLTDGPQLVELFWNLSNGPISMPTDSRYVYLVHPPEYSLFGYDVAYLTAAQRAGGQVEVRPYRDRQNQVAFYAIQFPSH